MSEEIEEFTFATPGIVSSPIGGVTYTYSASSPFVLVPSPQQFVYSPVSAVPPTAYMPSGVSAHFSF